MVARETLFRERRPTNACSKSFFRLLHPWVPSLQRALSLSLTPLVLFPLKEADAYEAGVEKQVQVLQSLNMITDYLSKENEALVPELDNIRSLINLRLERQHGAAPSVSKD